MVEAIETYYNGYRFRSRLEARWAVFFETLGIKFDYEPEGFEFDDGTRYLPDFWLKNVSLRDYDEGLWIEIKPDLPSDEEEIKMSRLVQETKKHGVILVGTPSSGTNSQYSKGLDNHYQFGYSKDNDVCHYLDDLQTQLFGTDESTNIMRNVWWDNCMTFAKCYSCQTVKIEFSESNYMYCPKCNSKCDDDHPDIIKAEQRARSARFEFGQTYVT